MAMLNFKYGLHQYLPQFDANNPGSIFVTTDEKAMYVDLPGGRIRVGQIVTLDTTEDWTKLEPPYSTEAFYYIINANALLKWTGTEWKQINSTQAITTEINGLKDRVKAIEDADFSTQIATVSGAVEALNTWKTTADTAITSTLPQGIQEAKTAAGNAQTKADSAHDVATQAKSAIDNETTGLAAAHTAAATAQGRANAAYTLAEGKTTMAEVEAKNYATQSQAQGYATAVQGDTTSTVKDAMDAIAETDRKAQQGVTDAATASAAAQAADTKAQQGINAAGAAQTRADNAYSLAESAKTVADRAEGKADTAQAAAEAAQSTANTGVTNAATAQAKADSAYELAETKTTMSAVEAKGYATTEEVEDLIQEIIGGGEEGDAITVAGAMAAANQAQQTADQAVTNAATAQSAANAAQETANKGVADAAKAQAQADKGVADAAKAQEQADKGVADAATAKGVADSAAAQAAANVTAIATTDAKVNQEIEDRKAAITALTNEVNGKMQAADAMRFIDVVESSDDLPASGNQVGDTYKAIDEFVLVQGEEIINVHIGDLLIASGDETDGVIDSVVWKHVPSGYVADYNPVMATESVAANVVSVTLTSGVNKSDSNPANNGDLGQFNVASAENSAIRVAAIGNNIQIGLEWTSFDPVQ